MAIDRQVTLTAHTRDRYPALFSKYIFARIEYLLNLVRQDDFVHSASLQEKLKYALRYALRLQDAWSVTHQLILAAAPLMEQAGHRDEWLPYLKAGLSASLRMNDGSLAAEYHLQLATLYRLMNKFDLAQSSLQAGKILFERHGQQRDIARTLNEMAWIEHLQDNHEAATRSVRQALVLLSEDDVERAMSYRVQGMIAIEQEEWQSAEVFHRKALQLFEHQSDRRKIAWGIQNLAFALRGQSKFQESLAHYLKAANILKELGDKYHWSMVQVNLGLTYHYSGKSHQALKCYRDAEIVARALGDRLQLARISVNRGLALMKLHEYIKAEQSFRRAISLYDERRDKFWRLNAMDGLAMALMAQQQYDQAAQTIVSALAVLPEVAHASHYQYLKNSLQSHLKEAKEGQMRLVH